jgi:hypothetical protein
MSPTRMALKIPKYPPGHPAYSLNNRSADNHMYPTNTTFPRPPPRRYEAVISLVRFFQLLSIYVSKIRYVHISFVVARLGVCICFLESLEYFGCTSVIQYMTLHEVAWRLPFCMLFLFICLVFPCDKYPSSQSAVATSSL